MSKVVSWLCYTIVISEAKTADKASVNANSNITNSKVIAYVKKDYLLDNDLFLNTR